MGSFFGESNWKKPLLRFPATSINCSWLQPLDLLETIYSWPRASLTSLKTTLWVFLRLSVVSLLWLKCPSSSACSLLFVSAPVWQYPPNVWCPKIGSKNCQDELRLIVGAIVIPFSFTWNEQTLQCWYCFSIVVTQLADMSMLAIKKHKSFSQGSWYKNFHQSWTNKSI